MFCASPPPRVRFAKQDRIRHDQDLADGGLFYDEVFDLVSPPPQPTSPDHVHLFSQIRDGKSPLSQPALIVSDPVQISQIRDGKSPLSQPDLIVSDRVQISQIRDGKSTLSQPFSVTNLGSPDRV